MKKNKNMAYAILGISFILFNIIAFVIPTAKTSTFFIAYAFTVIAFASQIAIWKIAFKETHRLKSKFLGIPLIIVGITYLFIQLISFAVFMVLFFLPSWIAIVGNALILGVSAICLIGTDFSKKEINKVEEKIEKKVFYIKALQVDVEMLASTETDTDTKSALLKLAEKIRFSDPMSSNALADIEKEIVEKINKLKSTSSKSNLISQLDNLLTERNKKLKTIK